MGVVSTSDAISRALNAGLDLVEVSPQADPPVARILDYGKMIYEREKQERKNRARSKKSGEVKGIRLSIKIGDHDMMVRANAGKKFMDNGDKLKLELILRGREKAHPELVEKVIERYIEMLDRPVVTEQPLNRLGGKFSTIIAEAKNS